ncbi:glycine--tRNA ligase subunit beta [Rhizorhapis suberifaciens]|uniref:Glycine--tRNA ligase beta subunit n=1 Tax=Rhizorhapis suberifaciens TaxID=13656 RepID=A0A840HVD9_9SPHN|nr:glycine--tRNA ligase subunit beta [Rhizorhapis suberifaciens]MBB4641540.1 glycyl-tRNA synthetase beta chain [Rhizorhapis suberifaciens]
MTDFLLELLSEEIPARMQAKASEDLARMFTEKLAEAGLKAERLTSYVTPRRLALIAHDLPLQTEGVTEERKGPRADAPAQALEGFLRSTGLTRDQLVMREDNKGNAILFAVIEKPGRQTADVIAEIIPAIIRAFPWPKSMRWGKSSQTTESLRWVRPLQGIVALLGDNVVDCQIDGIRSGNATVGHRFHHPGQITIGNAGDYAEKLRLCHVIVDQKERQQLIEEKAKSAAEVAGLTLVEDKGLVAENAGLTEWPIPLLGHFDPAFLEVPPEVIQLTMRTNQKYFAVQDANGKLAPAFICTANIDAHDGGKAIVAGNQKVLAARLSDARFFWEQDRKTRLEEHAKKLDRIVFHEKLGTVADKVDRVAKLARWLVEEGIISSPARGGGPSRSDGGGGSALNAPSETAAPAESPLHPQPLAGGPPPHSGEELADLAEQAAYLCKADLVTEMVGEFPELQGLMGGYYARAEGLPEEVANAIRDHYKPVGQGDDVPTDPVTVAVSLADKLDTLVGFFAADMLPTGSKDPFALRRAMLGVQSLTEKSGLRFSLGAVVAQALDNLASKNEEGERWIWGYRDLTQEERQKVKASANGVSWAPQTEVNVVKTVSLLGDFFADRLKVQQREAGVRHDLIDAVFALGGEDDLVRLLARVKALQSFIATEDGANLLIGYRRAANILKKEQFDGSPAISLSYDPENEEAALIAALDVAEPRAADAVSAEDFEGAMSALASLRAPIDAFFDKVTVNDADPAKRTARLGLLMRVRNAVHEVADFSRIEG